MQAELWPVKPAVRPAVDARPYQLRQHGAVFKELEENRSTLVVAATGTGKTTLLSMVARDWKGRVLVLAHRDEILSQLLDRLELVTGDRVGREQAESFAGSERIVVASVQTLCQPRRLERWPQKHFGLIIVDEAHHATAPTYRRILDNFEAKVLGVTATPDRGDERALGQVFDSVADVYDTIDAINDGYLVPVVGQTVRVEGLDLSGCKTTAGDLNQGDLDEAMGRVLEGTVKPTIEIAGTRRTVVFTTSVELAHRMCALFNTIRPDSATAVDGSTEIDERRRRLKDYAQGRYQFLVNVGIATEGWDDPETSCVVIGRPTKSRALYAQMVGRGLRPHKPSGKQDCLIIDFAGNAGRHTPATPEDVLGGLYDEDEVELAKEHRKANPKERVDKALQWAREELARRAAAKVAYRAQAFDPFAAFKLDQRRDKKVASLYGFQRASDAQRKCLAEKFFLYKSVNDVPENLSKKEATRLIESIIQRNKRGLAAPWRVKELARYGWTDPNIYDENAKKLIAEFRRNGGRIDPKVAAQFAKGAA